MDTLPAGIVPGSRIGDHVGRGVPTTRELKGRALLAQGTQLEDRNQFQEAVATYIQGLGMLMEELKSTSLPEIKARLNNTINTYMTHTEHLKDALKEPEACASLSRQSSRQRQAGKREAKEAGLRGGAGGARPAGGPVANIEPALREAIESNIVDHGPPISFADVAGARTVKQALSEMVILPMLRPDVFTGLRAPPKGLLLFGPPGTGKTLIAKALASTSNTTFFSMSASSLTSKYVGEGEKLVKALFALAREKQPSVIFIDEIDSILSKRSANEHEASRRMKTEFLVQFDGVGSSSEDRILVIGATNLPEEIDDAAIRRFTKRIYLPLPDDETRLELVTRLLKNQQHNLSSSDFDKLVAKTEGYSGSDLSALCKDAAMGPVRELGGSLINAKKIPPITYKHFLESLQNIRPSCNMAKIQDYVKWNDEFGSKPSKKAVQYDVKGFDWGGSGS